MRRLAWIVLFALAVLALPSPAFADKSFTVSQAFVTVTLARDGEVLVREDLTFEYTGFFTGAYRDIPLAKDVQVRDVRVNEGATEYTPGGNTALGSSDAAGRFGFVRLPQGLRIVWHYVQDGGRRTFTLRYRLRGVVIAHDDAVEVAPQVWGDQWKDGLGLLFANVQAPAAPGNTHAWIEPAWLSHRVTVRGSSVQTVIHDVPSKRSVTLRVLYPPSVLAPNAPYATRVHDDIVPATVAREQAAADRAAHDKQQLEDTLHHPLIWILALCALALVPALLLAAFAYMRFGREHGTGTEAKYVNDPPDDLAPALVPSLLAQRVVAGGDQLTATLFELVRRGRFKMTPVTRGVLVRRPAPQGGRRRRPHPGRRGRRALARREAGGRDLRPPHPGGAGGALAGRRDRQGPAADGPRVVPRPLRGVRVGRAQPGAPAHLLGRPRDGREVDRLCRLRRRRRPAAARGHRRSRRSAARAPGPDPHRCRRGPRPQRHRAAGAAGEHVAQAATRAAGLRGGLGGLPPLPQRLPAAGRQARGHAAAVGELPGLRHRLRHRGARARGSEGLVPRHLQLARLRAGPLPAVVQRRELRLRPRRGFPLALERQLGGGGGGSFGGGGGGAW